MSFIDVSKLEYRKNVGMVLINAEGHIFAGKRLDNNTDAWQMPQGGIDEGETIEGAVRREVMEESGIKVGPVTYLASQPWVFPNSLMFGCHGTALTEAIEIDPNEIDDAKWISKSELLDVFAGIDQSLSLIHI